MPDPGRKKKVNWTNLVLALAAFGLALLAWNRGGLADVIAGLREGGETLWSVTLLLIAAFLVAGLTQVLVPRDVIEKWLGTQSGWRGILLASIAGSLVPGGPYVYYPIAGALLQKGAGLGVLIAFIMAKNLWSISRLPMEFALLGPDLTLIRFVLTLVVPPALGIAGEALFGRYLDQIRGAVQ
jgi:uncharacterized membrane protein YraQ (UPF0718 family)